MTVRRLKTYAAESGCVFEYYFVGKRAALPDDPHAPATEYVFDVVRDGFPNLAVSVFLTQSALSSWQTEHGRDLNDPEQYAAAKMKLFRVFDEWERLPPGAKRTPIQAEEVASLLLQAGVD